MYSDATVCYTLGFGALFRSAWISKQWEPGFVEKFQPSIEFLEFYALCIGVFTWSRQLRHKRFILFCDNESVCNMVKNSTSSCKYCMTLIRRLVLRSLKFNFRVFTWHVSGVDNFLSDSLSRLNIKKFHRLAQMHQIKVDPNPTDLEVSELWPLSQYWHHYCLVL